MFLFKLLVIYFTQLTIVKSDPSLILPVLYNGARARIEDFPYFAATEFCGAAIISDRWLLTAAHCVHDAGKIGNRRIYVGGERRGNSIVHIYDKVVIHPKYRVQSLTTVIAYDIALLRLLKPLTFRARVKPVKLPQRLSLNPNLHFVGRGQDHTRRPSTSLMKINVRRLSPRECVRSTSLVEYHKFLTDGDIICGRRPDGRPGICFGDSGGPLVQDNTIIGLASFIIERDCSKVNIAYYTSVASYLPWIKSITGLT